MPQLEQSPIPDVSRRTFLKAAAGALLLAACDNPKPQPSSAPRYDGELKDLQGQRLLSEQELLGLTNHLEGFEYPILRKISSDIKTLFAEGRAAGMPGWMGVSAFTTIRTEAGMTSMDNTYETSGPRIMLTVDESKRTHLIKELDAGLSIGESGTFSNKTNRSLLLTQLYLGIMVDYSGGFSLATFPDTGIVYEDGSEIEPSELPRAATTVWIKELSTAQDSEFDVPIVVVSKSLPLIIVSGIYERLSHDGFINRSDFPPAIRDTVRILERSEDLQNYVGELLAEWENSDKALLPEDFFSKIMFNDAVIDVIQRVYDRAYLPYVRSLQSLPQS